MSKYNPEKTFWGQFDTIKALSRSKFDLTYVGCSEITRILQQALDAGHKRENVAYVYELFIWATQTGKDLNRESLKQALLSPDKNISQTENYDQRQQLYDFFLEQGLLNQLSGFFQKITQDTTQTNYNYGATGVLSTFPQYLNSWIKGWLLDKFKTQTTQALGRSEQKLVVDPIEQKPVVDPRTELQRSLEGKLKDFAIETELNIQAVKLSLEIEKVVNRWILHVRDTVVSQQDRSQVCSVEIADGSGSAKSIKLSEDLGCQVLHAVLSSPNSAVNFIRFLHWGLMRILNQLNLSDADLTTGIRGRQSRGRRLVDFGLSQETVDRCLHPEIVLVELRDSGSLNFIDTDLENSVLLAFVEGFIKNNMKNIAGSFNAIIDKQWQQFKQLNLVTEKDEISLKTKLVAMAFNRWERETFVRYTQS